MPTAALKGAAALAEPAAPGPFRQPMVVADDHKHPKGMHLLNLQRPPWVVAAVYFWRLVP